MGHQPFLGPRNERLAQPQLNLQWWLLSSLLRNLQRINSEALSPLGRWRPQMLPMRLPIERLVDVQQRWWLREMTAPVRAEKTEFEMHRHPDPNVHAPPDRPWTADGFLSDGGRGPRITLNQPCGVSTARQPRLTMLVNLPRSHEQRGQPRLILGTNHKQKLTCKSLSQNGLLEPKGLLPAFPFSLNLETL